MASYRCRHFQRFLFFFLDLDPAIYWEASGEYRMVAAPKANYTNPDESTLAACIIIENRYVRTLRGWTRNRKKRGNVTVVAGNYRGPYADAFTRCSLPRRVFPTNIIVGMLTTPHGEMPALLEIVFRLIRAYRFSLLPCGARSCNEYADTIRPRDA